MIRFRHGRQQLMGRHRNLDKLIEETRASQQNIVFPDTVRNGRAVDVFLWRGSPNPTPVQRIAAWMLGLLEMAMGLEFFALVVRDRIRDGFSVSIVFFAIFAGAIVSVGVRTFRNGFPRPSKPAKDSD
jgi:hypothetical protein